MRMMAQLRDTTAHQESSHFEGEQRGQQVRLDPDKRADIPDSEEEKGKEAPLGQKSQEQKGQIYC